MKETSHDELSIFWDYLGANKPFSGLHTHISHLEEAFLARGLKPQLLGKKNFFYEKLLALPLSKITCPHYSSFLMQQEPCKRSGKNIFHSFANINTDFLCPLQENFYRVLTVHDVIPLLAKNKVSLLSYLQFKFCLKASLARVDRVICVSSWTKKSLGKLYPEFSEKCEVVLNGYTKHKEIAPELKLQRESPVRLLSVSRYEAYKGFEKALDILKGNSSFHLTFVTNPSGISFLTRLGKEKGVLNRLSLYASLGAKALEKEYRKSDVYLCTSEYEGYGLPAIDAISYGVPVVYQEGHALSDFLKEGSSLALSPKASVKEWVDGLRRALELPHHRTAFFKSIEQTLDPLPSWDEVGKKVLGIYQSL